MKHKTVTITIPATTANLGPGFDCLGLALGLYNHITVTAVPNQTAPPITIEIEGEGATTLPIDHKNLIYQAIQFTFKHLNEQSSPAIHIYQQNHIPIGSGLGSSATCVLGGVIAANALTGNQLTRHQCLQLATQFEGHPDNVAPALYGGLILVVCNKSGLHIESIEIPTFKVVVILPDFDFPTHVARTALPQQVSLADAVFNVSHMGLLIRALATADYHKLGIAMRDKLHQPHRTSRIPGMTNAFTAARQAGATAVAISGAGPSIIAFAPDKHQQITDAITHAFHQANLKSRAWLLTTDTTGCVVTEHL